MDPHGRADVGGTASSFGLHHVQLAVPPGGEEACRRFYVEVLGLTEVEKPPVLAARGGLWLRADALEIQLGVEADFRPSARFTRASWSPTSTPWPSAG